MSIWKRNAVVALVFLFAWSPASVLAESTSLIELPAPSMGTVSFPHALHQSLAENCEICHHKGVERGSCTSCHEIAKSPPQGRDLFHQVCRNCHKEQGGPVNCAGCHTRPSG